MGHIENGTINRLTAATSGIDSKEMPDLIVERRFGPVNRLPVAL